MHNITRVSLFHLSDISLPDLGWLESTRRVYADRRKKSNQVTLRLGRYSSFESIFPNHHRLGDGGQPERIVEAR